MHQESIFFKSGIVNIDLNKKFKRYTKHEEEKENRKEWLINERKNKSIRNY